jgi:hypothetical protein
MVSVSSMAMVQVGTCLPPTAVTWAAVTFLVPCRRIE